LRRSFLLFLVVRLAFGYRIFKALLVAAHISPSNRSQSDMRNVINGESRLKTSVLIMVASPNWRDLIQLDHSKRVSCKMLSTIFLLFA